MLVGWFYWFQYRPTKIRHDCSWIKKHKDSILERPAQNIYDLSRVTVRDLEKKGLIQVCWGRENISVSEELDQYDACSERNNKVIQKLGLMKSAEPAKDWWIKTTKEEYQFCLHDKGL